MVFPAVAMVQGFVMVSESNLFDTFQITNISISLFDFWKTLQSVCMCIQRPRGKLLLTEKPKQTNKKLLAQK